MGKQSHQEVCVCNLYEILVHLPTENHLTLRRNKILRIQDAVGESVHVHRCNLDRSGN